MSRRDEDGLLSRWSRRKRAVAEESRPPEEETPGAAAEPEPAVEPETDESEEDILARFDLPVPESLKPGDDVRDFMRAGVPQALRRRALRRLWSVNPALANLDGLNDYDEDFNSPAETKAVIATAYRVGKGYLREALAPEKTASAQPEVDPPPEAPKEEGAGRETDAAAVEEASDASERASAEPGNAARDVKAQGGEALPRRPKRMRFES